jgi:thymidylate synthase (FAD)
MKIIQPSVIIFINEFDKRKLHNIEMFARICYKSKISKNYSKEFLKTIIEKKHESVIEHEKISVIFIVDRGISNQIIRHRIASYSQESTRYCNYSLDRFGDEIAVIEPFFFLKNTVIYDKWKFACKQCEDTYIELCKQHSPEEARTVLPNSLKTELATTYNFREWKHFFKQRCSKHAHSQMRQVTIPLLLEFQKRIPVIFDDIEYDYNFNREHYANIIEK